MNKNSGIAIDRTSADGAYKSSKGYLKIHTNNPTKTHKVVVKINDDHPISLAKVGLSAPSDWATKVDVAIDNDNGSMYKTVPKLATT